MLDLLLSMQAALHSPRLQSLSPPAAAPGAAIRSGKLVFYSRTWGDWTCPATQHCGIAARQGVAVRPGETCIATWYREDLGRTGYLGVAGRAPLRIRVCDYAAPADLPAIQARGIVGETPYPLAQEIPGMISDGWVTGTLTLAPIASTAAPTPFAGTTLTGARRPARSAGTILLPQPW